MSKRKASKRPENPTGINWHGREGKMIALFAAVFLIGSVALLAMTMTSSSTEAPGGDIASSSGQDEAMLVREDSWKKEAPGTQVTLVEFLDPECEACRAMYPVVQRVLDEYEGRITFVVRYFPLHGNSVGAAVAAEAAGVQGKYWEMYSLLFENQPEWGEKSTPQTEVFISYAEALSLDIQRFRQDLENPAFIEKVARDRKDGIAAGVRGTPTFFLNGAQIGNVMAYEELKTKLDSALEGGQ